MHQPTSPSHRIRLGSFQPGSGINCAASVMGGSMTQPLLRVNRQKSVSICDVQIRPNLQRSARNLQPVTSTVQHQSICQPQLKTSLSANSDALPRLKRNLKSFIPHPMSPELWRIRRPFELVELKPPNFRDLLIAHLFEFVELAIEDRSQVRSLDRDRMTILVPEGCRPRSVGSCGR